MNVTALISAVLAALAGFGSSIPAIPLPQIPPIVSDWDDDWDDWDDDWDDWDDDDWDDDDWDDDWDD